MMETFEEAPGRPGLPPRWTSSAKSGVGTAGRVSSRVWFSLSHGILNEIYFPSPDLPCVRDMGLIVTDGREFFSEEKRQTQTVQEYLAEGIPAYRLTNTCHEGRYRIEKEVLTDPRRDVLLQRVRFVPLKGTLADYRVHVLISPHIGKNGCDNSAWLGEYKGMPMLFSARHGLAIALACSHPWVARSVGFVGESDGFSDLRDHRKLKTLYQNAEHGNVSMIGEIDLSATDGTFVLALAFGRDNDGAAFRARASLFAGFESSKADYLRGWTLWQGSVTPPKAPEGMPEVVAACRLGAAVLRCHEDTNFHGGFVASLSIPWGFAKGDDDLGGYHVIWPRDLVEIAGGLLAVGATQDARRVLDYLRATQEADGYWPQNMWLTGVPYWTGNQMDETALPILLVDLARRRGALRDKAEFAEFWPMVKSAAGYIVVNGPTTQEDRWEENAGYTPFEIATEVAALLVAAEMADSHDEPEVARYLRETADLWNDSIESWLYAKDSPLAKQFGVDGYYVRIALPSDDMSTPAWQGRISIKNRSGTADFADTEVVSPDALAFVRFGLRAADDPRIVSTVRVIDATLKVETPSGSLWRRYNNDGYGEHEDGAPFDGTGIGRAWPLLAGERGHYELEAGHREEAKRLLATMSASASDGGMIPEQVWDAPDIPDRELFLGHPSGSAMPLAWAHAEYLKLARSLADGKSFDTPPQTVQRYIVEKTGSPFALWRFNHKIVSLPQGKILRVETLAAAKVNWSVEGQEANQVETKATLLGVHYVDLPTQSLAAGSTVTFTFFWTDADRWEGVDFKVSVTS